jgi:adenylate cyclase
LSSIEAAATGQKTSLKGLYAIGILSTAIGLTVIVILNMFTPLDYILDQLNQGSPDEQFVLGRLIARRFLGLLFLIALSGGVVVAIMRQMLKPLSAWLSQDAVAADAGPLHIKARQRLVNLPFMMVPVNIAMWIFIPAGLFYAGFATGRIGGPAALTLGIRSSMVGLISSAIMSFWLENFSRRRLIPLLFPGGRLSEADGVAKISISRRIRLHYRLGSVTPLAILLVTLVTLQWQVERMEITAADYGHGIMVFSIALFIVFFLGSGVLNRLISRSIADPVKAILASINEVRAGNFNTRIPVVSSDEVGVLGDAANDMIQGLSERELLRDAFGRYVAPEVRDEILSGRIPLDGEMRHVTVMFADIRDFTPMTESHDPKRVVNILNSYFETMAEAIKAQSGLVLQYLGDEIYAVFGAPVHIENHPARAFRAALAMKQRLVLLNNRFRKQGWPELRHGIGIHTGEAVVANIGSPERLSYLLVGDTVNLASRLQSMTKDVGCEVLFSEATFQYLDEADRANEGVAPVPPMQVKGKRLPVVCYKIT